MSAIFLSYGNRTKKKHCLIITTNFHLTVRRRNEKNDQVKKIRAFTKFDRRKKRKHFSDRRSNETISNKKKRKKLG